MLNILNIRKFPMKYKITSINIGIEIITIKVLVEIFFCKPNIIKIKELMNPPK